MTRIHSSGAVLRQITRDQRSISSLIAQFRARIGESKTTTAHRASLTDPAAFEDLVDEIEWILIRYPIPLLPKLGRGNLQLLYEVRWEEQPPRGPVNGYQRGLRSEGKGDSEQFDNLIRFFPDVQEQLASLASLFRPLIQREWSRFVTRCNEGVLEDVERFLFQPSREDLSPVRGPLLELQEGRYFYCDKQVAGTADVDHFLPWSRCGDNRIGNLVVADGKCNRSKRDHLAAPPHLKAWCMRHSKRSSDLDRIANDVGWQADAARSLHLVRSFYLRASSSTPFWVKQDEFQQYETLAIRSILEGT